MKRLSFILLLIPIFCFADVTLTNEQISQMPVETLEELLQTQPGIVAFEGEIHVDGYDTIDLYFLLDNSPISYSTALSINLNMIYKLEVINSKPVIEITEMYPVVIKIHTFPHSDKFHLNVSSTADQLSGDNSWNKNVMNLYINLPILYNLSISTFASIDRNDTRFGKFYKNDPVEDLQYLAHPDFSYNDPYEGRSFFDKRNYNNLNFFYKLSYDIFSKSHLTFSHLINNKYEKPFDHTWKYAMEYYKEIEQKENVWSLNYQQEINDKLNFNIGFDYHTMIFKENPQEIGLDDYFTLTPISFDSLAVNRPYECTGIDYLTDANGLVGDETAIPWSITSDGMEKFVIPFISPGSIYQNYIENSYESQKFSFDTDYTFNENHTFIATLNHENYVIKKYQVTSPWLIDQFRYDEYLTNFSTPVDSVYNWEYQNWEYTYELEDTYNATLAASGNTYGYRISPKMYSFSLQDDINYGKLTGSFGIKSMYWYFGKEYNSYRNGEIVTIEEINKDNRKHRILNPFLHLNYNIYSDFILKLTHMKFSHNLLIPNLLTNSYWRYYPPRGYDYYSFEIYKPIDENAWVSFNYNYHENQYQYIEYEEWSSYYYPEYHIGFLTSNSYKLSSSYQFYPNLKLLLNYSITNIENTNINWNIKHSFDLQANYKTFYDVNIEAFFSLQSGKPYILIKQYGEEKQKNMKTTHFMNLKLSKEFKLGKNQNIATYILVKNLYDRKNELYVYPYTGSPYYDGADISEPNSSYTAQEVQYVHDLGTKNPANVSEGRTIVVGLEYRW
jgi:hypothetical protein